MKIKVCIIAFFCFGLGLKAQNIDIELFAQGFDFPIDIVNAGDDRLFIVERGGKIKITDMEGSVSDTPFLDIESLTPQLSSNDERGLLGLAFHPNYAENGFLFINYTDVNNNTIIARYTVNESNPNAVDVSTRKEVMMVGQPFWNHNGGCIKFGKDGYLYIGLGDGGSGNDPLNKSQDPTSLLGKMLRIDIDTDMPYAIPEDNPFAEDDFFQDEIWSYGLRNPWRFSFDRETGDMWIGDVGQDEIEEIDFQPASSTGGENYGWRCFEGTRFTNNTSPGDCELAFVDPVYELQQGGFNGPCSITGGFVYRGSKYSELYGVYICADFCNSDVHAIIPDGQGGWIGNKITNFSHAVSTFGEDQHGELYFASFSNGSIYHIVGENIVHTDEVKLLEKFEIYPNPTSGNTQVNFKSLEKLELELQLIDMKGRVVLTKNLVIDGDHIENIEMTDFASGTYILQLSTKRGLLSKQLVVY